MLSVNASRGRLGEASRREPDHAGHMTGPGISTSAKWKQAEENPITPDTMSVVICLLLLMPKQAEENPITSGCPRHCVCRPCQGSSKGRDEANRFPRQPGAYAARLLTAAPHGAEEPEGCNPHIWLTADS